LRIRVLLFFITLLIASFPSFAQLKWTNVDSVFQPLPASVHVYFTNQQIDTAPFRAYYLIADLKDKHLQFTVDTSSNRRLIPNVFFERNNKPLAVVNTTFFSYETNRSLNAVIKDGELVAFNTHTVNGRGKDTFTYRHPFASVLGISKKRKADIAWTYTDSVQKTTFALQKPVTAVKDSLITFNFETAKYYSSVGGQFNAVSPKVKLSRDSLFDAPRLEKWKMGPAVGGGPVLLQEGEIKVTNNEELKFVGKAINDKHPRTAMGYTKDGKLIILMIEGRNNAAHGATLTQEAQIFKDLGCWEALNLDGGGSSCLLVNGKETIKVSDALGQRPVPAVFIIRQK